MGEDPGRLLGEAVLVDEFDGIDDELVRRTVLSRDGDGRSERDLFYAKERPATRWCRRARSLMLSCFEQ
jgi:hypothetical protein